MVFNNFYMCLLIMLEIILTVLGILIIIKLVMGICKNNFSQKVGIHTNWSHTEWEDMNDSLTVLIRGEQDVKDWNKKWSSKNLPPQEQRLKFINNLNRIRGNISDDSVTIDYEKLIKEGCKNCKKEDVIDIFLFRNIDII